MEKYIQEAIKGRTLGSVRNLNLSGCQCTTVSGITEDFRNLESLDLERVGLNTLKGFPSLQSLKKLNLTGNKLSGELAQILGCTNLKELNLCDNEIRSVEALRPLAKFKNLEVLNVNGCDVTKVRNYESRIFKLIGSLVSLNGLDKDGKECVMETVAPTPVDSGHDQKIPGLGDDVVPDVQMAEENVEAEATENVMEEGGQDDQNAETQEAEKSPRKRKAKGNEKSPKKKKMFSPPQAKNALMQLNELKPGLKYVVDSMSGPAHNPEFVVSVQINEEKYIGKGNSKQLAKHAAAQAALSSFVQFRNTSEVMSAINPRVTSADFTSDNIENETNIFNQFEPQKNGNELCATRNLLNKNPLKVLSESDKKNPVMLLNEIHPGLTYETAGENAAIPTQRFRVTVEVDGEVYEGTGPNKRLAKASAARSVLLKMFNINFNMHAPILASSEIDPELFNFPQSTADKISRMIMDNFSRIMSDNPDNAKWKVLAGIAMTRDEARENIQIISFGTGTKCINGEHISMNGAALNDCHAEIISRRCLKDFLFTQLELHLRDKGEESIFVKREGGSFSLKPNIKFHLYISTAPCGDARIFCPHEEALDPIDKHPNRKARGVLRTKIESGEGTIPVKPTQFIQTWDGIVSGQERVLTMSCSDKIASWNVLGLQGSLLSQYMDPIYLDSIILGGLFHPNHLPRALFGRIETTLGDLPPRFRLHQPKMRNTTSPEMRQLAKSPNFSVNWTQGTTGPEVINAITGKSENGQVSRLAKRSFFQRFVHLARCIPPSTQFKLPTPPLYAAVKTSVADYSTAKRQLCNAFASAGLGNWVKKPVEQNEFELSF